MLFVIAMQCYYIYAIVHTSLLLLLLLFTDVCIPSFIGKGCQSFVLFIASCWCLQQTIFYRNCLHLITWKSLVKQLVGVFMILKRSFADRQMQLVVYLKFVFFEDIYVYGLGSTE